MSRKLGKYVRKGPPAEKKFDMMKEPMKQPLHIMVFVWFFTTLRRWAHLGKVHRVRMKGVKPPYILLCNHSAFVDFYVMCSAICPHRGCYPAAVDDFIGREYFLRRIGGRYKPSSPVQKSVEGRRRLRHLCRGALFAVRSHRGHSRRGRAAS